MCIILHSPIITSELPLTANILAIDTYNVATKHQDVMIGYGKSFRKVHKLHMKLIWWSARILNYNFYY